MRSPDTHPRKRVMDNRGFIDSRRQWGRLSTVHRNYHGSLKRDKNLTDNVTLKPKT